ncbi:HTH-type transcriptional activator RhaS [compost metagenome]
MPKLTQANNAMQEKQAELATLMEKFTGEDGVHATIIPKLQLIRNSNTTVPIYAVQEPELCIIAQGAKVIMLGQQSFRYGPADYLIISVDLPVSGQVVEASPEAPYLCLMLNFEPSEVFDIMKESDPHADTSIKSRQGLYVSQTNEPLMDAVLRLLKLLETPQEASFLAPMAVREILFRIMNGAQGEALKQIAMAGSGAFRIADVIKRIKKDYDKPLRTHELAHCANMSTSSLHRHFREVTTMSPLQYQKQLRLQEARRLLLSESADAADAAFRVGYESPSQFSREYSRLFGLPPISDVKRMRQQKP